MSPARPPLIARLLLYLVFPRSTREFAVGDVEEEFAEIARVRGSRAARRWYWAQAVRSALSRRIGASRSARSERKSTRPRWNGLDSVRRDARIALRSFGRHPGATAVATITLALGIGATTAIFSFANWLLIRPVSGVHDPGRLIVVQVGKSPQPGWFSPSGLSYLNLADLVSATSALGGLAGYQGLSADVAVEGSPPRHLALAFTTANYFDVIGVRASRGRTFVSEDDRLGAPSQVAVLSDRLAAQLSGGREVVGRTIRVNGEAFSIIGVAPPGFHGTERLGDEDLWLPGGTYGLVMHFDHPRDPNDRSDGMFYEFVGRLAPGANATLAEQQLLAGLRGLAEAYPEPNANLEEVRAFVYQGIGIPVLSRPGIARSVRLLMGIVLLVLLIAVANVANMMLYRGVRRRGETAVRRALGATGGSLLRQHLTEGLLLAGGGGLAGIAVALLLTRLLSGSAFFGLPAVESIRLDGRVLAFTLGVSVLSGLLFSLAPAYFSGRVDLVSNLKEAGRAATLGKPYLRGALLTLQLAASMTLVVGGLLFVRTLRNYARVDLGFQLEGLTAFAVSPGPHGQPPERMREYYREMIRRLGEQPGIGEVAVASRAPLWGISHGERLYLPGQDPEDEALRVSTNAVSPSYFRTFGTPTLRGRSFREEEFMPVVPGAESVIILNQAAAQRLFGDRDPVGQYLMTPAWMGGTERRHLVIGLVPDTRWGELTGEAEPQAFQPFGADPRDLEWAFIFVRSLLPAFRLHALVQETAADLDAMVAVHHAESMMETFKRRLSEERLFTKSLSLLALLALGLAAVGLYGVVAYGVAERTREFGIRLAMGAKRRDVLRLVIRGAMGLTAVGVVLGLGGSVALTRVIASRLYGVSPLDPPSYLVAIGTLVIVALAASIIPARSATRVDPIIALRYE